MNLRQLEDLGVVRVIVVRRLRHEFIVEGELGFGGGRRGERCQVGAGAVDRGQHHLRLRRRALVSRREFDPRSEIRIRHFLVTRVKTEVDPMGHTVVIDSVQRRVFVVELQNRFTRVKIHDKVHGPKPD